MKILYVIEDMSSHSGGPPVSTLSMASALSCLDNEISFLCYEKDGHNITIKNAQEYPGYEKICWHTIPNKGYLEHFIPIRFSRKFLNLINQYDIISLHNSWRPLLIFSGIICLFYRKPYIVTPHGSLDKWALSHKKWKKFFVWHLCWKWIVNCATVVRALTLDEKNLMREIGITSPIEVIANGFFSSKFNELQSLNYSDYTKKELSNIKKPYILFLSRIHYKKGLDILITAFSFVAPLYHDLTLVIAGPDENYWSEMQYLINKLNINDRIMHIGPIYGNDKFRLLKNSVCFCLTSRQEGFSMAIIEAMSVGAPVIISENCHFNELKINDSGIVTTLDIHEVSDAIINVISDQEKSILMGIKGSKFIYNSYTWESLAIKFNKVLSEYISM
jgi:glycosyltransferase involved in cell wall biosynthesis